MNPIWKPSKNVEGVWNKALETEHVLNYFIFSSIYYILYLLYLLLYSKCHKIASVYAYSSYYLSN